MPKQYVAIEPDEWYAIPRNKLRVSCCDCGLVHDLEFRVVDGQIEYRVCRNNRATAAKRRK